MKTYIGYRIGEKAFDGEATTKKCVVNVWIDKKKRPLRPRLDIRNHSPGVSLEDSAALVVLFDVAIGAKKLEPFRPVFNVTKRRMFESLPAPLALCARIGVVKVESRETSVVAATLASSAEVKNEPSPASGFTFSPAALFALRTKILPSFVADVRQRFSAFIATPISFEIDAGAYMLSALESWHHPTAQLAAPFLETHRAVPRMSIGAVGNSAAANNAEERRIGSYRNSEKLLIADRYSIHRLDETELNFEWGYSGSGPAQLALALVADCCGREFAHPAIYQRVKAKIVAGLPHDGWTLTEAQIKAAVDEAVAERDRRDAANMRGDLP